MDKAITVGEVFGFLGVVGTGVAVIALIFFLIWLFNPFRTGH